MSIRYLNCASMSPGSPLEHRHPCLLVDPKGTCTGDTSLGLHDYESPSVCEFYKLIFASSQTDESALRRVSAWESRLMMCAISCSRISILTTPALAGFSVGKLHLHRREVESFRHPKTWLSACIRTQRTQPPTQLVCMTSRLKTGSGSSHRFIFTANVSHSLFWPHKRAFGVSIRDGEGWVLQAADACPMRI